VLAHFCVWLRFVAAASGTWFAGPVAVELVTGLPLLSIPLVMMYGVTLPMPSCELAVSVHACGCVAPEHTDAGDVFSGIGVLPAMYPHVKLVMQPFVTVAEQIG